MFSTVFRPEKVHIGLRTYRDLLVVTRGAIVPVNCRTGLYFCTVFPGLKRPHARGFENLPIPEEVDHSPQNCPHGGSVHRHLPPPQLVQLARTGAVTVSARHHRVGQRRCQAPQGEARRMENPAAPCRADGHQTHCRLRYRPPHTHPDSNIGRARA